MAQKQILPFSAGTRRRKVQLASIPYVENQNQDIRLPKVGYGAEISLRVFLQASAAAAAAFTGDAAYKKARAVLKGVFVQSNQATQIVQASAWGLNLLSYTLAGSDQMPDELSIRDINVAPAGAGQFNISFRVTIPLSFNQGLNYTTGLLNLQNDDVETTLALNWGSFRNLFDDPDKISNTTGYAVPVLTYYDVPSPMDYMQPPMNVICKIAEQVDPISANGEYTYQVSRGNIYSHVIHQIINNGAPAETYVPGSAETGNVKTLELRMQKAITDFKVPAYDLDDEATRRYGARPPKGTLYIDNASDTDQKGRWELGYNFLDSAQYSSLDHLIDLQNMSGSGSQLLTVTRQLIRLA